MNGNEIGAIVILCLFGLCLLVAGITVLVCHIVDRRRENKWYKALANDEHLRELVDAKKHLWEVYIKKSDIANGYKKQIDILLTNLVYLPSYEKEWREAQAEIYKQQYFEAQTEASKWYDKYLIAHSNLDEYCETHKLRRIS